MVSKRSGLEPRAAAGPLGKARVRHQLAPPIRTQPRGYVLIGGMSRRPIRFYMEMADQLPTPEQMAACLHAWREEAPQDGVGIARVRCDIACSQAPPKVARDAGLSRESHYRYLNADGNPSVATVLNIIKAWGLRLLALSLAIDLQCAIGREPALNTLECSGSTSSNLAAAAFNDSLKLRRPQRLIKGPHDSSIPVLPAPAPLNSRPLVASGCCC